MKRAFLFFVMIMGLVLSSSTVYSMEASGDSDYFGVPTIEDDLTIYVPDLCFGGEPLNLAGKFTPYKEPASPESLYWSFDLSQAEKSSSISDVCAEITVVGGKVDIDIADIYYDQRPWGIDLRLSLEQEEHGRLYWEYKDMNTNPELVVPLYLWLDPDDLDLLFSRDPFSGDRLPATVRIGEDGETVELDGVRFRGSSTRLMPKKSYSISFEEDQELLFGSSRMNANAMYTDPSMMREYIAWGMFAQLDRPAPRIQYLDLWINDVFEGLYLHIERIDSDFLVANGLNPDGTLVRDQFKDFFSEDPLVDVYSAFGFDLSEIEPEKREEFLDERFRSRGNPRWDLLADLILWVNNSEPGADFYEEFVERFEKEIFIDWLAIHYLVGDIDSWADDYWLYLDHDDEDAKWIVIPWDKDLSFGSHWRPELGIANDYFYYEYSIAAGWHNSLLELFLNTPELRKALDNRLAFLMQEVFTRPYFEGRIQAAWNVIGESVQVQPSGSGEDRPAFEVQPANHFSTQGVPELHNEVLLDFVDARYEFLKHQLGKTTGGNYSDSKYLENAETGDVFIFSDSSGWTLARLELLETPSEDGKIDIEVYQDDYQEGVDRIWEITSELSPFEASLTLYYRNEMEDFFKGINWYTGGSEAVGDQWDLAIFEGDLQNQSMLEESRVNPFSNKVETPVVVQPGENYFAIGYKD